MSNCSILRVGPIDCGDGNNSAAILHSAIVNHFSSSSSSSSSPSTSSAEKNENGNPNNKNLLTITNRYFDARILLAGLHDDESSQSAETTTTTTSEDGIILTFNASSPIHSSSTSFDTLSPHHESAMANNRCGDLLRLCVGVYNIPDPTKNNHNASPLSDGSKKSEEEYSRRVLWCLDRGYEYVEVDVSEEGLARGFEERDKDGFARVVEAIGSCMWSSHVMKRRVVASGGAGGAGGGVGGGIVAAPTVATTNPDSESGEPSAKSQSNASDTESKTASSSSSINDSAREKAAMASLLQGINDDNNPLVSKEEKSEESATYQQQQQHQQHQKDEMAFHQLEHVLSEAKMIRDASQGNSMSDEERRERAGDTAMKLMGLLDGMGFGDDDSEDDGSHSSSEDEQ